MCSRDPVSIKLSTASSKCVPSNTEILNHDDVADPSNAINSYWEWDMADQLAIQNGQPCELVIDYASCMLNQDSDHVSFFTKNHDTNHTTQQEAVFISSAELVLDIGCKGIDMAGCPSASVSIGGANILPTGNAFPDKYRIRYPLDLGNSKREETLNVRDIAGGADMPMTVTTYSNFMEKKFCFSSFSIPNTIRAWVEITYHPLAANTNSCARVLKHAMARIRSMMMNVSMTLNYEQENEFKKRKLAY